MILTGTWRWSLFSSTIVYTIWPNNRRRFSFFFLKITLYLYISESRDYVLIRIQRRIALCSESLCIIQVHLKPHSDESVLATQYIRHCVHTVWSNWFWLIKLERQNMNDDTEHGIESNFFFIFLVGKYLRLLCKIKRQKKMCLERWQNIYIEYIIY